MTDEEPNGIRNDLKNSIKGLTRATIALFLSVIVVLGFGLWNAYDQRTALQNEVERVNTALCTFVDDLERRVQTSIDFLESNPNGIPGLPDEIIRESIANQRRTIGALSGLECS